MGDLRLIAWLRWRELRSAALYWLRVAGYEPGGRSFSERSYAVYLLLFGSWWALAMVIIVFHEADQLGESLPPTLAALILLSVPWAVLIAQALLAAGALRASPCKLTFPDMAWIAGSPVAGWAPVLVAFLQAVGQGLLLGVPPLALLGVALARVARPEIVDYAAAASSAAVAIPLLILTTGLGWSLGLARMAWPRLRRRRLLWLIPLLLLPLGRAWPAALLWPGRVLAAALGGEVAGPASLELWALALGVAGLVAWLGQRANLTDIADESQTYARLRALGVAAWAAPDVAQAIRRQAALAARRPSLRLPRAAGRWPLLAKAALIQARRRDAWPWALFWGVVLGQAAAWLILPTADSPLWVAWLSVVLVAPGDWLAAVFRLDAGEPFLRQFVPPGNLRLLLADTAAPLLTALPGALAVWLFQGAPGWVMALGLLLTACLGLVVALCHGVGLLRAPYWGRRIPHELAVVASLGAVILGNRLAGRPLGALATALALIVGLGFLVEKGRPILAS